MVPCHALWVGDELGPLEKGCLASFVAVGHPITIHVYNMRLEVPRGVLKVDARQVMPENKIFRHYPSGSYAHFADVFRYKLLSQYHGIYVDCDVFCLAALPEDEYLFGFQSPGLINNAVLRLPPTSNELQRLIRATSGRFPLPSWISTRAKLRALEQMFRYRSTTLLAHYGWGSSGPDALTRVLHESGKHKLAKTTEAFYPLAWQDVSSLVDPNVHWDELFTQGTYAIHLFKERLKDLDYLNADRRAPIWKIISQN